jgi:pyruvate/2-oxoglutarate dehydrogenase complex dihydrolipoamide acyltransferase (E2) component
VSSSPTETRVVDVTMPQMGVSVAEGTVVEWRKQVGDAVEADEVICSISTDKIDTDVEAPAAGTLADILVDVGTTVDVGTVLATIDTGGGDARPQNTEALSEAEVALEAPGDAGELSGDTQTDHPAPAATPAVRDGGGRRYSPVVQRIAAEHGIDLSTIHGTGRGGRVRKQDVLAAVQAGDGPAAPAEPPMHIESPYRPDEPAAPKPRRSRWVRAEEAAPEAPAAGRLSRMRQTIGEHMLRSLRTAATCTTVIEVDMSRVEAERRRLGVTALPLVARATVATLREFPALNATLDGEDYTRYDAVHLGIAVSLGEEGLIVPVVRDAQDLSAEGLAARIRDLATRARSNGLTPDEVRGGTFTITNPGQYGSIMATPVINQPQVAILDLEAIVKRPVVVTGDDGADAIAIRPMTILGLSWDHRALDGAQAAQFLAGLKARLEAWPVDGT